MENASNTEYRQCAISVMDTIADPEIRFDEKGISNYYYQYLEAEKNMVLKGEEGLQKAQKVVDEIKSVCKNKKYDCILGISGGVDSTYLAYVAKQYGLRLLCVHFDNGWNSELAVKNIENIISKLGFDLFTYVINWEEFKDIQRSYFKAHVIDIEAVTDIAIFSALNKICLQKDIKYILDGRNVVTEEVLPSSWINKSPINLQDIHSQFGTRKLKSYPLLNFKEQLKVGLLKPFTNINLLNYIPYNKAEAKETIIRELEWRDYGGKHYESIFTRFYQGYILPEKFKVDKRKAHLSNLIFSGQITKEEALEELKQPIYGNASVEEDKEFVIKKLDFTPEEFDAYIAHPPRSHNEFKNGVGAYAKYPALRKIAPIYRAFKKLINIFRK